jgi:hypothetical protein
VRTNVVLSPDLKKTKSERSKPTIAGMRQTPNEHFVASVVFPPAKGSMTDLHGPVRHFSPVGCSLFLFMFLFMFLLLLLLLLLLLSLSLSSLVVR